MSRYFQTTALVASLAATAYAHGRVTSITADGTDYEGFLTDYIYTDIPADLVAWSADNGDNGFVDPTSYSSSDIACHKSGAPGGGAATVAAGSSVTLQWGPDVWPESHHGPVLDYLAHCAGDDCSSASPGELSWVKIAEAGLNDGSTAPGQWASDDIIANNGLWEVTIPESLAPGQYVLRHEIIALHSAGDPNGAQNYPQCFNLEVTGSGSASPEGVTADQLYTADEAGITASIYTAPIEYTIPGPALWDGASSGGSGAGGSSGGSPPSTGGSTSAAAPAPSAPATSAPAPTSAPAAPPAYTPEVPATSAPYGSGNSTLPAPTGTGTAPTGISTSYVATTSASATTSEYGSPTTAAPQPPAYTNDVEVDPVTEASTSSAPAATSAAPVPSAPAYGGSEEEEPSYPGPGGSYGGEEDEEVEPTTPGGSYGGGASSGSDKPSMADLLEWIEYYVKKGYESDSGRKHARDMRRRL